MNVKLEKVRADIQKLSDKAIRIQDRLKELERQKINLENQEIIAMFRREKLTEEEFAALVHGQKSMDFAPHTITDNSEIR
jgi:predicted  nucleic acid-binding Zn-ribbon protein